MRTGEPGIGLRWLPRSPWQPGLDSRRNFPRVIGWESGWFSNNFNVYILMPLTGSESRGGEHGGVGVGVGTGL